MRTALRASRGEIGQLAIGFVPSADLDILPRVLRVWGERFPRVEIELHSLLPVAQIEALRDDRIQVGFIRLPAESGGLVVETIQREPLLAVLPAGHPLGRRDPVRLADLEADPMIAFPRRMAPGYYDLLISACRRAGVVYRDLAAPVPYVEMAVAYRPDGRSAVVPAFLQILREVVPQGRRRRAAVTG